MQRCIDAVGDAPVVLAILPAGTGNLLARNLGIPIDLEQAVDVGLHGAHRTIDVGRVNGERFAVMAGTGLDALMIRDAGRSMKDRFGRAAYVWTGAKNLKMPPFRARIEVDGTPWFDGKAGCILVGNVGKVLGGVEAFDDVSPEDGLLELGRGHGQGHHPVDARAGADRGRERRSLEVRPDDEGEEDQDQARSQDALRARRRRREAGRPAQDQGRTGGGHDLRPGGGDMSTARFVPETWELSGDEARETLRRTGRAKLVRDAFVRFRASDGFSHARSLAFVTSLLLVQGVILLVGLAAALGDTDVSGTIVRAITEAVPGPAGKALTDAVFHAYAAGASGQRVVLVVIGITTIITGTTLMGQMERALNRQYGIEQDRPTLQKYGRATGARAHRGCCCRRRRSRCSRSATASARVSTTTPSRRSGTSSAGRIALVLMMAAIALLFRWSPNRHQPAWSWLAFGSTVSVLLWSVATLGLGLFFQASTTFSTTYGPLAGMIALLLWALLLVDRDPVRCRDRRAARGGARRRGRAARRDARSSLDPGQDTPIAGPYRLTMPLADWFLTASERGNPDHRDRSAPRRRLRLDRGQRRHHPDRRCRVLRSPARGPVRVRRRRLGVVHRLAG